MFGFKKSFLASGLFSESTDIHCHLLPEVDDGIKNYSDAVSALCWIYKTGIRRLYLTPHIMSDFPKNDSVYLSEQFDRFIKQMEMDGITDVPELKLGAEYMLEASFSLRQVESLLTYNGRHVLIETSYLTPPFGFKNILSGLIGSGFSPVLAHPERYQYLDRNDYKDLKTQKIKYQLNYISLTGVYGKQVKEKAERLLKEGLYDFVGSDLHRPNWHRNIVLLKKLSKKQIHRLRLLFENNQQLW